MKKGFTLIELLVVITIIGILATWGITVYTSQMQKARDSTRIKDIKWLQSAVEQFSQDTSLYPHPTQFTSGTSNVNAYLPRLASDPRMWTDCNNSRCGYVYAVNSATNLSAYELSTAFESSTNLISMAANSKDGWTDANRYEEWTALTLGTAQAAWTWFWSTTPVATSTRIVILRNSSWAWTVYAY